jgi:hypothetical protein
MLTLKAIRTAISRQPAPNPGDRSFYNAMRDLVNHVEKIQHALTQLEVKVSAIQRQGGSLSSRSDEHEPV